MAPKILTKHSGWSGRFYEFWYEKKSFAQKRAVCNVKTVNWPNQTWALWGAKDGFLLFSQQKVWESKNLAESTFRVPRKRSPVTKMS